MPVLTSLATDLEGSGDHDSLTLTTTAAIPAASTVWVAVWNRSSVGNIGHAVGIAGTSGLTFTLDSFAEGDISGGVSLFRSVNAGGSIALGKTLVASLSTTQNRYKMMAWSVPGAYTPDKSNAGPGNGAATLAALAALTADAEFVVALIAHFTGATDTAAAVAGWTEFSDSAIANPGTFLHSVGAWADGNTGDAPAYHPVFTQASHWAAVTVAYKPSVTAVTVTAPLGTGSGVGFAPLVPRIVSPPQGLGVGIGLTPSVRAAMPSPLGSGVGVGRVPQLFTGSVPNIQPPVGTGIGVGHTPNIIGAVKPPGLKLFRQGSRLVLEYA